jgi:GTPase SAR1 family protein
MKSYINLKKWYKNLKNNCDNIKILGIIANKIDLDFEQIISKEEGENYAKRINALFFETSSMQYEYVDSVFEKLVEKYINDGYNYEIFLKNENNLMNQSIMSSKSENIRIENDRDNSKSSSCLK